MAATVSFLIFALLFHFSEAKVKDLVTEFVKKSGSSIFKEYKQFGVLLESKKSDDYDDHLDEFNKAANKFENKVKFVYIDTDVEENWKVIEYLGIFAEEIPAVIFIDLQNGITKYKGEFQEITKRNVIDFIQGCLDGKQTSFLKSQEIPEDWDAKPVKILVGKNFDEVIIKKKKTALVFFHAPWCSACQNAMPEIEKLGLLYENDKEVMIAKMDSSENEVPHLPILDVPLIALFLNGENKPIIYQGEERNANELSKFIVTQRKETKKEKQKADKDAKKDGKKNANKEEKKKAEKKQSEEEKSNDKPVDKKNKSKKEKGESAKKNGKKMKETKKEDKKNNSRKEKENKDRKTKKQGKNEEL